MVEEAGRVQIKQPWGYCCNLYSILRVGFYVILVTKILRRSLLGTSLVVQGLRLCLPMQGVQFPSLVGELRSHMPLGQKTKTANRNNIVTNLIKTFKKNITFNALKENKLGAGLERRPVRDCV